MCKQQFVLVNGRVRTIKEGVEGGADAAIGRLMDKGYIVQKIKAPPTLRTLEKWMFDGVAKATDGCKVEPDGTCCHGHRSWLLQMGVI